MVLECLTVCRTGRIRNNLEILQGLSLRLERCCGLRLVGIQRSLGFSLSGVQGSLGLSLVSVQCSLGFFLGSIQVSRCRSLVGVQCCLRSSLGSVQSRSCFSLVGVQCCFGCGCLSIQCGLGLGLVCLQRRRHIRRCFGSLRLVLFQRRRVTFRSLGGCCSMSFESLLRRSLMCLKGFCLRLSRLRGLQLGGLQCLRARRCSICKFHLVRLQGCVHCIGRFLRLCASSCQSLFLLGSGGVQLCGVRVEGRLRCSLVVLVSLAMCLEQLCRRGLVSIQSALLFS
mmetsp:Transcript_143002/g.356364  ORF Transcript_143002/g.356364 Transcript_143002/m.356364 type:complete len:283 (-) Transcript_143002:1510-2358(-)